MRIRSALTVAGALGVMVLPVAAAIETVPAHEATTPPTATATASPTPTPSPSAPAEFAPGPPSPQQPTPSPDPTSPPNESVPPTQPTPAPTPEPTPEPEPTEAPSTVPAPPQPSAQPTEEVAPVPAPPQPSDEAQPLPPAPQQPAPQQSTEEAQGAAAALSPWTLGSTFNSDRITGVLTPPLAPVDSREAAAVASGRLPASVLGLTNPQYVERQNYDGTSGWVESFLNSNSGPLPRSDSSTAAGVVGAEAREGGVSAMPSGNVFERGIAIVSGSGPLVVFTGIAACGLMLIVGNFMRQSRTDKR